MSIYTDRPEKTDNYTEQILEDCTPISEFFEGTFLKKCFRTEEFRAILGNFLSSKENLISNPILKQAIAESGKLSFTHQQIITMRKRSPEIFEGSSKFQKVNKTIEIMVSNLLKDQTERDLFIENEPDSLEGFIQYQDGIRFTDVQTKFLYLAFQVSKYFGIGPSEINLRKLMFMIDYLPGLGIWLNTNGYEGVVLERINGKVESATGLLKLFKLSEQ